MSDFDGVVESITGSGGVVESAELEVFDVVENDGTVDFKLIFRFKVPQYKVKDTSELNVIKEATKDSFVENAQNMDSSLIDASSISFKEGTPLLHYSVPEMQPIFAQKISSCNPCKIAQPVITDEPIIKGRFRST